jgi:hypothetical protein
MKEGEEGRAFGTCWWGNLMKRYHMEDIGIDERVYGSGALRDRMAHYRMN